MGSDNTYTNIEKRTLYIHQNIDQDSISRINWALLEILQKDNEDELIKKDFIRNPIKLFINSNGGNVDDCWSLIDIILNSKTPIYTYCTGYAHSCGLFIFLSGEKRYISNHTKMLYHQIQVGVKGEYQFIKDTVGDFDYEYKQCENYILERTNIDKERLDEVRDKKLDWYIKSDELIEYGIATDYIDKF